VPKADMIPSRSRSGCMLAREPMTSTRQWIEKGKEAGQEGDNLRLSSSGHVTRLAQVSDDQSGSSRTISRGSSWCCAGHRYWLLTRTRMVQHTYLGTDRRSRCQRCGLLLSGFSLARMPALAFPAKEAQTDGLSQSLLLSGSKDHAAETEQGDSEIDAANHSHCRE
jgi:hypothetical protein